MAKKIEAREKYRTILYVYVLCFIGFTILGVICDFLDVFTELIPHWCPNLFEVFNYDFENRSDGILGILGIIWGVTSGVLFFVIQYGYGKKMGLDIYDILLLIVNKGEVYLVVGLLLFKLLIYGYCFVYNCKWGLLLLPVEGMVSLVLIIIFVVHITSSKIIVDLIKREMDTMFSDKEKVWKCNGILEATKGVNYDDNVECDGIVECIVYYIKNMDDIRYYIEEHGVEVTCLNRIQTQVDIIKEIIDGIYVATKGGKRMLYVMQECISKLQEVDAVRIYLLLRSTISRSVYAFEKEDIRIILETVDYDKQLLVRDYLYSYLEFMANNSTEQSWSYDLLAGLEPIRNARSGTKEYKCIQKIQFLLEL